MQKDWKRLTSNFLFLLFPPVFRQMNDIWHTNHPKVKKCPRLSLNLCVAFPFLFLSLSTATHPSMELSGLSPSSISLLSFSLSFSLVSRLSLSLSLSLSQIFIQIFYSCSIEDLKIEGVFKIHKSLNSSS